jgi:hypothetical protein
VKTSLVSQFVGRFFISFLLAASTWATAENPIKATLCAIVSNPLKFDGKLVQITAFYESDGIEHSILTDDANCKWGIAPIFPEKLAGEDDLGKAVRADHPGTLGKVISATWVGVFRYHPGQVPRWVIRIHQMSDFKFTCVSCPGLRNDDPIHLPESPTPRWPPA